MNRRSRRRKFFTAVFGLGATVFLLAAFTSCAPDARYAYAAEALTDALEWIYALHPRGSESVNRLVALAENGATDDAWHEQLVMGIWEVKEEFDIAVIYLVQRHEVGAIATYRFILSSWDILGTPAISDWDWPPPELIAAFSTGEFVITDAQTDPWGTFMMAFLPVIENDRVIAVWGADFSLDSTELTLMNFQIGEGTWEKRVVIGRQCYKKRWVKLQP